MMMMMVTPPVFEGCTRVLDPDDQKAARDLYWEAICSDDNPNNLNPSARMKKVESLLRESIVKNPFVGEPHLVLAQVLLNLNAGSSRYYDEAAKEAEQGLRLLLQWGSSWDKRMSWEGWVSWVRVMRDKAKQQNWPTSTSASSKASSTTTTNNKDIINSTMHPISQKTSLALPQTISEFSSTWNSATSSWRLE
ncbi:hypothetical protein PR202_ga03387 [Eleusine coracana subsp. coracana]|uniref:Uncharacterized protein n=1 Tax=Eleusine coracana subsp. coracana TaxID=191504 RepID=A0AAV5BLZ9_ELECO|nr:hypothetical protein PR202_ga03387 [Eleusine coracana subsp. coracana]